MNTNKTLYAALAFGPLVLIFGMFVMMGFMFAEIFDHPGRYQGDSMPPAFGGIMMFSALIGLLSIIGLIVYILHVTKNKHIPEANRTMWILIVALAGAVGMAIYYFTWIRKEDELNAKMDQQPGGNPWK
jgi:hypothetical protein